MSNAPTRKPTPSMSPVPEKWTWQMAEAALGKNKSNRNIRPIKVIEYIRLMVTKLWGSEEAKMGFRGCVAPIIFDWYGNLIDGQHRLLAQVESKTTQYWYVLRDVPTSVQEHVDQPIQRSASDVLKFAGYINATTLQGVARWAWLLEQGKASSGGIGVSSAEIKQMVINHPDLEHSAGMAGSIRSGTGFFDKLIGPTPVGAAHWWIAQHNDHIEADMFLDRMTHMNREPDGSAILALWSRLNSAKGKENIQLRIKIAMIVRAWNADISGRFVKGITARSRTGITRVPKPRKRLVSQEERFGPAPDALMSTEAQEEGDEADTE